MHACVQYTHTHTHAHTRTHREDFNMCMRVCVDCSINPLHFVSLLQMWSLCNIKMGAWSVYLLTSFGYNHLCVRIRQIDNTPLARFQCSHQGCFIFNSLERPTDQVCGVYFKLVFTGCSATNDGQLQGKGSSSAITMKRRQTTSMSMTNGFNFNVLSFFFNKMKRGTRK